MFARLLARAVRNRVVPPDGETGRVLALTSWNREFDDDRIFDPDRVAQMRESLQPMALPWLAVARVCAEAGLQIHTADRLSPLHVAPKQVNLISYDWTPEAAALVAGGAAPRVLLTLEPPVIAWSLYANLSRISAAFPHTFIFRGARERVSRRSVYHPMHFPQVPSKSFPAAVPWRDRGHLVMINSNKGIVRSPLRWFDRPREVQLKRELAALRYPPIAAERYSARLRAISALADLPGFDLYGEGWDKRHPAVPAHLHRRALSVYRGATGDKHGTLGRYRFALAMENTRFPGYISEKLFDCFYAGCVPVYSGAPDVLQFVPAAALIDATGFNDFAALDNRLRSYTQAEWEAARTAGQEYLHSAAFQEFSVDRFARSIVAAAR